MLSNRLIKQFRYFVCGITILFGGQIDAQTINNSQIQLNQEQTSDEKYIPSNIVKTIGHYTKEDWAKVIDETWGDGLPTSRKVEIFDTIIKNIDQKYAAFFNLEINLDSLNSYYRLEIKNGVSRGRFAGILSKIALSMMEAHTLIKDSYVSDFTKILPGVPIFVIGGFVNNSRFGASLTPLPDSSLLVYKALPRNALNLEPGDIILGYDGIEWKYVYKELLDAELPVKNNWAWGSTNESMTHCILKSAGLNWHLFDTIDIIQFSSGDTLHLSTSLLTKQSGYIWGNEQLEIPGVPMPDFFYENYVTYGIVEGTEIGYIYVASWDPNPLLKISNKFYAAIHSLMYDYETTGMIIDFRLNYGGYMPIAHYGYSLLFNETVTKVAYDIRNDVNDHFDMRPHKFFTPRLFTIVGNPDSFYDKPIAVLTGPGAVSNGDWESLRLKFHPHVRTFGKPSSGAFTANSQSNINLGDPDFFFMLTDGCGYLIDDHKYLAHTGTEIDENVWLTQEDVANGDDTVVKSAIAWINKTSTSIKSFDEVQNLDFHLFNNYPNPFNPSTIISYYLPSKSKIVIKIYDIFGSEVATLEDEIKSAGNHSIKFNAENLSSGIYFYQMKAGNFVKLKKMILLK
ncbi:MAG: T9SS type A sorting domain-containing protein [Bacteroidetes bacterium]|nr:T9SS type A sorting domain-containing protein [Bacteroidota bacterium]MBU1115693.1 T9SS type A sorting domain-containing protein [Bacteroidota bacterium]MBU1799950.1 T9SS type A sorting domain-containing protein [Bacteroidota bacterium]